MLVINSVLGDATGGRWQVVCDYARLLKKQGNEVLLLLGGASPKVLPSVPDGIEVQRINSHGHYDWIAAWKLARRLREREPAVAVAHCSRSVALLRHALDKSVPVIAVTHSTRVKRLLKADAVIALTEALREKIEAESPGRQVPVYVVPNQISPLPDIQRQQRPLQQPPRIGALGRFDPVKGFDVFIEALSLLAQQGVAFSAKLAGAGKEEARLREQIRVSGLGDRIELTGWIAPESVPAFLASLDVLCVPARSDAFGLTPLQGAASGVPLLLSEVSGHRAMFSENEEALFFSMGDADELAERIGQLLRDPRAQRRLPAAALDRVERCYSETVVAQSVMDAINNILILFNNK